MKVRNAVTEEEENREKIINDLFISHYKCELNKVLDHLICDITDICTYMKEVIMPLTILHPKNVCSCTEADAEILFSNFATDLNDSDGLFCYIELVRESITESDAETIQEIAKFLTNKQYKYPNLLKAYQIALTIPVSIASSECSFSKLKIVKNYLRSTMAEEWLDALIATCSSEVLDNLDLDKLANAWSLLKTRRNKI